MYIELDHDLVPGQISGINDLQNLPTGKESEKAEFGRTTHMTEKKYQIQQGHLVQAIKSQNAQRIAEIENENQNQNGRMQGKKPRVKPKNLTEFEAVAGSESGSIYYDHDWGFFAAVLACYNNHWVLKTCPDDWWNIIGGFHLHLLDFPFILLFYFRMTTLVG